MFTALGRKLRFRQWPSYVWQTVNGQWRQIFVYNTRNSLWRLQMVSIWGRVLSIEVDLLQIYVYVIIYASKNAWKRKRSAARYPECKRSTVNRLVNVQYYEWKHKLPSNNKTINLANHKRQADAFFWALPKDRYTVYIFVPILFVGPVGTTQTTKTKFPGGTRNDDGIIATITSCLGGDPASSY